jgi:hypothetical protein
MGLGRAFAFLLDMQKAPPWFAGNDRTRACDCPVASRKSVNGAPRPAAAVRVAREPDQLRNELRRRGCRATRTFGLADAALFGDERVETRSWREGDRRRWSSLVVVGQQIRPVDVDIGMRGDAACDANLTARATARLDIGDRLRIDFDGVWARTRSRRSKRSGIFAGHWSSARTMDGCW